MNLDLYRNEESPRREVLPGGAVLLTVPVPSAHSVTVGLWLRTGSQDEQPELNGISHFVEHIVFKGSANRSAYEIASTFDRLGVTIDAFTTKDQVAFTIKVLPEYLEPAIEVLADMLLRPALDPRLISLEQDVVCEEIQEALDSPEDRLHDAFAASVYAAHRRSRPILGTPETVRSFDENLLRREHQRLFSGPNVVIAMAGLIGDNAGDLVRRHFDLPSAPAAAGGAAAVAVDTDGATDLVVEPGTRQLGLQGKIVQSYFEIGNIGVSYRHPDRIPVFVLCNLLGGGMSSRIFQAVREREGLAYTVYNYSDMGRDIGLVSCSGSCSPENEDRTRNVVCREYERVIADDIDEQELANNKAQIKSQLIFSLEGVVNQMYRAAKNEIYYGRFLPVAEIVDRIDAIERETIVHCANKYFSPDNLLFAFHRPE